MRKRKLNILLIMPKVDIGYQDWPVPPIGIAYISAALKAGGFRVFNINLNLETDPLREVIKRAMESNNIDIVGTGGLIVNYHAIKEIIDISKEIKSEVITYIGGSLVTFSPEAVMRGILSADIGMLGEGEYTACELAQVLEDGAEWDALKNVKGLIIRDKNGELNLTPPREEISDIDMLPWPDYDGFRYFDMIRNYWNSNVSNIVSAPLTTSRSCPFQCTFCSKSGGEKYRQRMLDNIFEELEYLINKYGVNRVLLNDELFANDSIRINEFCDRIKKYRIKWFVSLRVSRHITKELLEKMKESGCIQILYGLESGDDTILKSMRKGITAKEIERVVHLTAEAGFQVRGNFIFGDPAETTETVYHTIAFIERNRKAFASVALSPIILFPGSKLYKDALANGTIRDELEFIEEECPLKNVSKMSDDEYFKMLNEILPHAKEKLNAVESNMKIQRFYADPGLKKYWMECKCPACEAEGQFLVDNSEVIMRTNQYICEQCQMNISVNVTYEFAQLFYECLKKICAKYRTALWGCGQNMAVMEGYVQWGRDLEFCLIDTNKMKIGKKGIGEKVIFAPEEIRNQKIEFVIELTSVRRLEIINRIRREFPEVQYAYSMFDIPLCTEVYMG